MLFFEINCYWSIVALQCVLVSIVQQNESAIHIPISPLFWTAIPFRSPQCIKYKSIACYICVLSHFSCVRLCTTPRTVARQASLFMGFSRQEYWSGLPCPPPGDLSDPGIEPTTPESPAWAGGFFTTEPPGKPKWKWKRAVQRKQCSEANYAEHLDQKSQIGKFPPYKLEGEN